MKGMCACISTTNILFSQLAVPSPTTPTNRARGSLAPCAAAYLMCVNSVVDETPLDAGQIEWEADG